jgi:hypothetical protein
MAKVSDFTCSSEVTDIMVKMVDKFPKVFAGFDANLIKCVHTNGKASKRKPLSLRAVKYPYDVWLSATYIVEVAQETWAEMTDKQKNLATFHIMCAIPEGAFDAQSKNYAGKKRPDHEVYDQEFAVSGGILNWMDEDNTAEDPLAEQPKTAKKVATGRHPVTAAEVANA